MLEFTTEGLVHNLDTIEELVCGATECLTTEGLEDFGVTLMEVAIYVTKQTRARVLNMEEMKDEF